LLNRNTRAGFGSQLVGLSIVNPLFSKEIFSCFNQAPETTSKIVMEFLACPIFMSTNFSSKKISLQKTADSQLKDLPTGYLTQLLCYYLTKSVKAD
jgi:hypothetical protein